MSKKSADFRRKLPTDRPIQCDDDDDFIEIISDSRPPVSAMGKGQQLGGGSDFPTEQEYGTDNRTSPQSPFRSERAHWIECAVFYTKMAAHSLKESIDRVFCNEMRIASSDKIQSDDCKDLKLCMKLEDFTLSNVR